MSQTESSIEPQIVDGRQSPTALRVQRGVMRFLRSVHDMTCFAEVPLSNGRRADVIALGGKGEIWIVEIKSSLMDYKVDAKWPNYKDFCDRFFSASRRNSMPKFSPQKKG